MWYTSTAIILALDVDIMKNKIDSVSLRTKPKSFDYFLHPTMKYVFGDSLHKRAAIYSLLGLYHASLNSLNILCFYAKNPIKRKILWVGKVIKKLST